MTATHPVRQATGTPALETHGPARPAAALERLPQTRPGQLDGYAMLVGSSGGHLAQLRVVADLWPSRGRTWVTFDTPDAVSLLARETVHWAHHPTTRSVTKLIRNTALAWRVLRRERPDVVLSTGAAVAVPFFVLAWLLRIPTVYIEVYDRLDTPTLTGRLCRPFSSLFCVQWEEQRTLYRGAVVVGTLL